MNQEQGNYFRMFLATQEYLDNQTAVWSTIPKITAYKNDLDELIARITETSDEAKAGMGVSGRKEQLREVLALKVAGLAGMLRAYAHENKLVDLRREVPYTRSDLLRLKEQDVAPSVRNVLGIARTNLEAMADYGMNEAMLTETETTLEEFVSLIGKPLTILNNRYQALSTVEQLVSAANNLLRNQMDNIMLMYQDTNPEFYTGYERARNIVNR